MHDLLIISFQIILKLEVGPQNGVKILPVNVKFLQKTKIRIYEKCACVKTPFIQSFKVLLTYTGLY